MRIDGLLPTATVVPAIILKGQTTLARVNPLEMFRA